MPQSRSARIAHARRIPAVAALMLFASPAAAQVFNYIDPPVDVSPSTASTWEDVPVATWVPVGATGVIVQFVATPSDRVYGIRENGSTDTWMISHETAQLNSIGFLMTGLDSNRIFEVYAEDTAIKTYLVGYTMPGVTFFTNAIDKSLSTTGSYQDIDISADTGAETAIGALITIRNTSGSASFALRMKGSADDHYKEIKARKASTALIGVDGSEVCELKIGSTSLDAYLVGYVTDGAVFLTNGVDKSTATTGSYVNVDITADIGTDDANGAILELVSQSNASLEFALRKEGATYDYNGVTKHEWGIVSIDDNNLFEQHIETDNKDIFLVGYTLGDIANHRSIGTNTGTLYSVGDATIALDSRTITFGGGASLPTSVGRGDKVTIGGDTYFIKKKNSTTQVTVHDPSPSTHTNAAYTITRAYNDFQSWETARQGNLVADNRREVGVAYNDGVFTPSSSITISGSTTDSTRYMMITVAESQRHSGIAGTGVVISGTGHGSRVIVVEDEYTIVEWLEIKTFATDAIRMTDTPSSDGGLIQNVIIHDFVGATRGVNMQSDCTLRNSIIYNGRSGIRIQDGANGIVENTTFYDMTQEGVDGSGTAASITVRNSISLNGAVVDFDMASVAYFDHNMYSTLAGTSPGANDKSPPVDHDDLFISVVAGSENLHLEDSGNDAVGTGLDLSSSFTTDIDNDTRMTPWDMGADQTAAAVLTVSSGQNQSFTVGDPATLISPITVTDAGDTPLITAANDIRIMIPAGFDMDWDIFDTAATITGSAAAKVSSTVSYEASDKTLVIDVTTDFAASDSIAISDLNFKSFGSASSADNLELDVTNDAVADATDDKTITIVSPPVTENTLVSWKEIKPGPTAPPPASTITFDSVTTDVSSTDRSSATFSHTVGACTCCEDRVLIVVCTTRGDQGCTGVTYDGLALTQAISEQASTDPGNEWVSIWYLTNPPTGTITVAATFGILEAPTLVAAMSYFGVDQLDPIGASAGASSTSSNSTVTVNITTTVNDSVVVGGLGHHGGDTDPHDPGPQITTEHYDEVSGGATSSDSGYAGGEIITTTAGSYTFEWTGNASDDWAIACVELKPAS